jgi:quercetin dioxygenase-like cupin family protein
MLCEAKNNVAKTQGCSMFRVSATSLRLSLVAIFLLATACTTKESAPAGTDLKIERFTALKWSPALPGVEVAILSGNPEAAGQPYSLLIKCADGAGTKPHTHPTDGSAVILRGTYVLSVEGASASATPQELSVGDYVYVPKNVRHSDACKGETILYAHGLGPLDFKWVNPADDPSKSTKPQ